MVLLIYHKQLHLSRHGLASRPLLLRLLHALCDFLRSQPRRRIVAELLDQAGNRREHAGLLLVLHQPLDELRIDSLTLRRSRQHRPGRLHALYKSLAALETFGNDDALLNFTECHKPNSKTSRTIPGAFSAMPHLPLKAPARAPVRPTTLATP